MSAGPKLRTAAGKVKSFGTLFDAPNSVGSDNPLLMIEGNFSVTPQAVALTTFGYVGPVASVVISVPSGSLVITTNRSYSDKADAAILSLVGSAPTVSISSGALTPSAGALSLAGSTPVLGTAEAPSASALALAGNAPSVIRGTVIPPLAGAITASGLAPILGMSEAPNVGTLALVGSAPILGTAEAPGGAVLSLAGNAPTVSVGAVVTPSSGTLTASGAAPILATNEAPAAAGLTLSGSAPSLVRGTMIQPLAGALTMSSSAPAQGAGLTPSGGALLVSGSAPSLNGQQIITPAAGQLSTAGASPSTLLATTITPASGAIAFGSGAPALISGLHLAPSTAALSMTAAAGPTLGLTVSPGAAALSVSGAPAQVVFATLLQPAAAALLTATSSPSIAQTNDVLLSPPAGSALLAGFAPAVSRSSLSRGVAGLARGYDGSSAPFVEFYHSAGEVLRYGIDWSYWLARFWSPGQAISLGEVVRSTVPNGFQNVCIGAGVTQSVEPIWPTSSGASILDGTVAWSAEPLDNSSLSATVVSVQWSTAAPIVLSNNSLTGQVALVLVDASQAVSGVDYDVLCTVTLSSGPPMVGRLRIKVR